MTAESGKIRFASLFSGIGMADLAARWCGWSEEFYCEIDPFCLQVLRYHFKGAKEYNDIKETYFGKWRGQVDVLHGSPPCQAVSAAGKRRGDSDDRWLWPDMLRVIREIRPRWISFENVANLKTMVSSRVETHVENGQYYSWKEGMLSRILDDIEGEGYTVQAFSIPACAVGAPHRRERIWIVANYDDTRIEGMRQGGEDEIRGLHDATDHHGAGLQEKRTEQQATGIAGDGIYRYAPDAERVRGGEIYGQVQSEVADGQELYGYGGEWDASKPEGEGLERVRHGHEERVSGETEKRQLNGGYSEDGDELPFDRWWRTFPTQSPVFRGDDGNPFGLVGSSIPLNKWRKESIKAVGNALVPQVIYEFFRAIDNEIRNGESR